MTLFPSSNILASFPGPYPLYTYIRMCGEPGNKASTVLVCLLLFHLLITLASIFKFCVTTIQLSYLRYFCSEHLLTSHDVQAKITKVLVKHFCILLQNRNLRQNSTS